MNNKPNSPESTDSTCMAYGKQVEELLSMSDASVWIDDLWTIYTGFMIAQKELGYNPRAADLFCTFRDLVFFFQRTQLEK
jgi:hypothetical protein